MDYLAKAWSKVRAVLISMPPSQRYTVTALLALVAVSLAFLLTGGSGGTLTSVYSGLDAARMSRMDAVLKSTAFKYEFSGGSLLVDPSQKEKVQMVLAEKGVLPVDTSRSYGYADLVKPAGLNFDTADERRMKQSIAVGNELGRQIAKSSPEIKNAWVNIARGKCTGES